MIGDFSDGLFSFYNNKLTTFDSAVFKPILQQISNGVGYLEVNSSKDSFFFMQLIWKLSNVCFTIIINVDPFDCSVKNQCGLAWLIRDNPQYLNSMWSAQCSNGTYFFKLNAKDLKTPKGSKCP